MYHNPKLSSVFYQKLEILCSFEKVLIYKIRARKNACSRSSSYFYNIAAKAQVVDIGTFSRLCYLEPLIVISY